MDSLEKEKLICNETRNRFGNKLVLIEPKDADIKLEITKDFDLAGAAGDGEIAVCAIDSCPTGIYAKEALESLGVFARSNRTSRKRRMCAALSASFHAERPNSALSMRLTLRPTQK